LNVASFAVQSAFYIVGTDTKWMCCEFVGSLTEKSASERKNKLKIRLRRDEFG
jgi:hypothetical protein